MTRRSLSATPGRRLFDPESLSGKSSKETLEVNFPTRIATLAATLALCMGPTITLAAPQGTADNTFSGDTAAKAAAYCHSTGGVVQTRRPAYGTNSPSTELVLSGERKFCVYTNPSDGSQIYLFLDTLYTKQPNLAALAYYAEVPLGSGCHGNPASCYCTQLGGTDLFGGINAAGGGWIKPNDPIVPTLETCIFPDLSSIDSWGLTYHSAGIIRGIDLSTVLRYANPSAKTHGTTPKSKAARVF